MRSQIKKCEKRNASYPSALDDANAANLCPKTPQTISPAYRLAYRDPDFLLLDELRPVRLQLELLKPEIILNEHRIEGTIIFFGGARIPDPESAQEQLTQAEAAVRRDPLNPSLQRIMEIARRKVHTARYYGEARRLAALSPAWTRPRAVSRTSSSLAGGRGSWMRPIGEPTMWARRASVSTLYFPSNKSPTPISPRNCVFSSITSPFVRCIF